MPGGWLTSYGAVEVSLVRLSGMDGCCFGTFGGHMDGFLVGISLVAFENVRFGGCFIAA